MTCPICKQDNHLAPGCKSVSITKAANTVMPMSIQLMTDRMCQECWDHILAAVVVAAGERSLK